MGKRDREILKMKNTQKMATTQKSFIFIQNRNRTIPVLCVTPLEISSLLGHSTSNVKGSETIPL